MSYKRKIKNFFNDILDRVIIFLLKRNEIKKFKDSRRKKIYQSVKLTNLQKKQIDKLYKKNYKKIPYTWHRHYTAFTGQFDVNYFPELLYIPVFEHIMNAKYNYATSVMDKNFLPLIMNMILKEGVIQIPKTILSCTSGVYRNSEFEFITKNDAVNILEEYEKVFIKPSVDSCSGKGCFIAKIKNGIDIISGKSIIDLLENLGSNFTIQECIKCHNSITKIYSESVNTFRVISYRWKDEIVIMPVIMRIGSGGKYLDNAHAGGMFIGVNKDGTLLKTAYTEFKKEYNCHPDSNVVFEGYKIENFEKVLKATRKAHELLPQLGSINWDFTINESGDPVLIEANVMNGGIWMIEMAHGKGPFCEKTDEILRWIRFVERLPMSKRDPYLFGYMK